MEKFWYFANDLSEEDYLSDSAAEIFKTKGDDADAFRGIAREVIQNSLDAKRDDTNLPLVLDFKFIDIAKEDFPDLSGLKEHIEGTIKYCEDGEKKNIALINSRKQRQILSQDSFCVLKISDYNTKGVSGSDDLESKKNKWKGLVYNEGDSIKDDSSSLGSFGLGKNASFAISSLRTVFYVTRDLNDNYAMEGVAKLYTSYLNDTKKAFKGYFCNFVNGKTQPIKETQIDSLSPIFKRNEYGTDVIIFEPNISLIRDKVKWYLIESIITNFFVAFLDGGLEVKVDGVEINQKTLFKVFENLINFYSDNCEILSSKLISVRQYLETIEKGDDFSGELDYFGHIDLKLYKSQDVKFKNVAIFREGGMLIKEYPVASANQKFSGVLIVKGKEGNDFLKSIEDPSHCDFDPSRETEDQELTASVRKTRLNAFYSWIAQNARDFTHIDSSGSIALSGMEEYIQMTEDGPLMAKEKREIAVKKIKRNRKKERERIYEKKNVDAEKEGLDTPDIPHNPNPGPDPKPNDINPDPKELVENEKSKNKGLIKVYTASFTIPPVMKFDDCKCSIIFKTSVNDKTLNLKLSAIGEDGKENTFIPKITNAIDVNSGRNLKVHDGVIYGISSDTISKIEITFENKLNTRLKAFVYWEEEK